MPETSLCASATQTSFTQSEWTAPYSASPALLPSTSKGASDREATGMLKDNVVSSIVTSLKNSGIIPTPTPSNPTLYVTKQTQFIQDVKAEYCYYESRYTSALSKLLTAVASGYPTSTDEIQSTIQSYLAMTQGFNKQLNDLTQIINAIVGTMLATSSDVDNEITEYNRQIRQKQEKLDNQNRIISSNEASMKLKKQMVKYTEEKARYTNNLLNMYCFLNVVTLGLLIYVYKAAGDT
jgi:hypothetical protein